MAETVRAKPEERLVHVPVGRAEFEGKPEPPRTGRWCGVVRARQREQPAQPSQSPRCENAQRSNLATLLVDLLTPEEEVVARTAHLRFDIGLLTKRLIGATDWLTQHPDTQHLRVGYFGASTGAAAALVAAAERPDVVGAIVSRGGRPDLAGPALAMFGRPRC